MTHHYNQRFKMLKLSKAYDWRTHSLKFNIEENLVSQTKKFQESIYQFRIVLEFKKKTNLVSSLSFQEPIVYYL